MLTAFPTSSTSVTLKGVVVATRPASSTGAFGFVIEDPAGGPASGIKVLRSKTSTSTATPPAIGDLVTVTGTSRGTATTFQQIDL